MATTRALFGSFLVLVLAGALSAPAAAQSQPLVGEPAPAFDLPSLDGERLTLADLRGKLVVLHFGAGW